MAGAPIHPMEEMVPCPICGSHQFAEYIRDSRKNTAVGSGQYSAASFDKAHSRIVSCKNCGLVFLNPRPPTQFIIDSYRSSVDPVYLLEEKARVATAKRFLKLIRKFEHPGRILDVGCAAGFFLRVAREAGWETYGVECSRWLAEVSRDRYRLDIKAGTLQECHFPDGFFDAVAFWDSLEHIPDPCSELYEASRIVKDGGHLFISYPNVECFLVHIFKRRHWWFTPGHLFYFSKQSLCRLVEKAGFKPVYSGLHFPRYSMGYLVSRLKTYSPMMHRLFYSICRLLRIDALTIPCYASQSILVAVKA